MAAARVLVDRAVRVPGRPPRWVVPIEIRSLCDVPLEEVQVRVELTTPEGEPAEIDVSAPYLAERATDLVQVVSEREPSGANIAARVVAFKAQRGAAGY